MTLSTAIVARRWNRRDFIAAQQIAERTADPSNYVGPPVIWSLYSAVEAETNCLYFSATFASLVDPL